MPSQSEHNDFIARAELISTSHDGLYNIAANLQRGANNGILKSGSVEEKAFDLIKEAQELLAGA